MTLIADTVADVLASRQKLRGSDDQRDKAASEVLRRTAEELLAIDNDEIDMPLQQDGPTRKES